MRIGTMKYKTANRAELVKIRKMRAATPKGMAYCSKCERYKLVTEFYNCKATKSGKAGMCKICKNKMSVEYIKNRILSPIVKAQIKLYAKRFKVIKKAGISIDEGGMCSKIDALLKKHKLRDEDFTINY